MGFTPPVPQKYTDWEIRAAVLVSLGIQLFLIFVAPLRRKSASRLPRFMVWSLYLLADWIADLALGLLLNNMGNIGSSNTDASLSVSTIGSRALGGKHPAPASDSSSSPIIFAFWAPFLLLHLGGPDTITAYSIEDAELWLRHLIGLLFELFAALVVFSCSLSGNPLIPATVFMFVVGILKYGERTYSLYCGSIDGFRDSVVGKPDPGPNYAKLMEEFKAKKNAKLPAHIEIPVEKVVVIKQIKEGSLQYIAYQFYQNFRRLFVDLILSFDERKISQDYFLSEKTDSYNAFTVVEMELSYIYDVTYTKAAIIHTYKGYVARCIGSACIITAIIYFVALNKKDFHKVDIAITYTLLIGAIVLDGAAHVMLLLSDWTRVYIEESKMCQHVTPRTDGPKGVVTPHIQGPEGVVTPCTEGPEGVVTPRTEGPEGVVTPRTEGPEGVTRRFLSLWKRWGEMNIQTRMMRKKRWGEMMSQLNLISYCLDNPVPQERWIYRICCCVFQMKPLFHFFKKAAEKLCCTEMLDQTIYVTRKPVDQLIKNFIFDRLKIESKKAKGTEEIRNVCNSRGLGAFEKIKEIPLEPEIIDIKASFDEHHEFDHSLLLWHIATELCYRDNSKESPQDTPTKELTEHKEMGKLLSDYMLYLLVMQPAMLMTTAGIGLIRFRDTCAEAHRFFEQGGWNLSQNDACKLLINVDTSTKPAEVKGDRSKSVLFDACILAQKLLKLKKEKKLKEETMWKLIAEVWAEMLFYTASHCRGYGHVRQLSKGGEMLTIVWLLMAHLGLGEMYKIQGGHANAKLIAEK